MCVSLYWFLPREGQECSMARAWPVGQQWWWQGLAQAGFPSTRVSKEQGGLAKAGGCGPCKPWV